MMEPTTLAGICLIKAFFAGIIGNLVASAAYDTAKCSVTDFGELIADDLKQGKLPANHDLAKLAHRSLRQSLWFAHAACAHELGEKQPFLPAMLKAWKEHRLFEQPLNRVRDTPQHTWLDRYGKSICASTEHTVLG